MKRVLTSIYEFDSYGNWTTERDRSWSAGVQNLIVDVRENGGGNSALGNELIDMFNARPYRDWASRWKRSVQYLEDMRRREVSIPDLYLAAPPGQVIYHDHMIINPSANPLRFKGKVYVLGSRDSFSSAQMFLTQIKDNGLATIIGEETKELACSSGEMSMLTLPNSKLRASFSAKDWIRPAGCRDQSGAVPDVLVRRTVSDHITGKDTSFETTLNLIKQRGQ